MSKTASPVVDPSNVETADRVTVASDYHEWVSPLIVTDVDEPTTWAVPLGDDWKIRTVELRTRSGTEYRVDLDSHGQPTLFHRDSETNNWVQVGTVHRFEPLGDGPAPDEDVWYCGKCGYGPSTQHGVKIHNSRSHDDEPEFVLEEDAPADAGDDVQEEIVTDDITVDGVDDDEGEGEEFECSCGATFETQRALQGHGPNSCEESEDEDGIDLPDGVTDDDVDELTSGGITIGTLADELGVHRNRARLIAFELGYYKRVREVFN